MSGDTKADGPIIADYLDREELARELGVSYYTIMRLDRRREGPPSMLWGKKRLYHREKARRWFESLLAEQVAAK